MQAKQKTYALYAFAVTSDSCFQIFMIAFKHE